MDTASLESAYRRILDLARTASFATPPAGSGEWGAELVLAHVTVNDELLLEAARAVLAGVVGAAYDNGLAVDEAHLAAQAEPGLAALVDRLQTSSHNLVDVAIQLDTERAGVVLPVHIVDGGQVMVDQPMPMGRLLDIHAEVHLPSHLSQLESRRAP
ncbi:MAG TPA: hypothetical protein VFA94_00390 [Acidimicrobiales bacterium]|nr:hypothetical protein [Acidimicrobiales bacterium]